MQHSGLPHGESSSANKTGEDGTSKPSVTSISPGLDSVCDCDSSGEARAGEREQEKASGLEQECEIVEIVECSLLHRVLTSQS